MAMSCEETERAIPWLLDDELEAAMSLEVETHIGGCDACRAELEREGRLRLTLRRVTQQVQAPAALRRSVREAIEGERRRSTPSVWRAWPAVATAAVFAALIWKGAATGHLDLETAAAEGHARDLPMDVVAADMVPVQDYFNKKLPFAVRLPTLPSQGVKSFGGRITHLRDRDAAYVRYDLASGRLSVFVYEEPDADVAEVEPLYQVGNRRLVMKQVRGYTVAKWRNAGLTYSMVTDLPEAAFSSVLQASLP
jgi:anti-sigma factor RsiW